MTDRQLTRDVKVFSEAMKAEAVKLGDYDRDCGTVTALRMNEDMQALWGALRDANFTAMWHHESVIEISARIAALAMSVAASSRRALENYEALRA